MAIFNGEQAFLSGIAYAAQNLNNGAGQVGTVTYGDGYTIGYSDGQAAGQKPENRSIQGRTVTLIGKSNGGLPNAALTPTWSVYVNAVTGASQTAPTITNLGGGNYKFVPNGANPAGILDLGPTAVPRYLVYSSVSSVWVFAAFSVGNGAPIVGLTPTWFSLKKSDGTNYTPQPAISALSGGLYKTSFLAERVSGVIDLGVTAVPRYLPYSNDRSILLLPTHES